MVPNTLMLGEMPVFLQNVGRIGPTPVLTISTCTIDDHTNAELRFITEHITPLITNPCLPVTAPFQAFSTLVLLAVYGLDGEPLI